jgi:hypothetical protein
MILVIPRGSTPDALLSDRRGALGRLTAADQAAHTAGYVLSTGRKRIAVGHLSLQGALRLSLPRPTRRERQQQRRVPRDRGIAGDRKNRPLRHSANLQASTIASSFDNQGWLSFCCLWRLAATPGRSSNTSP